MTEEKKADHLVAADPPRVAEPATQPAPPAPAPKPVARESRNQVAKNKNRISDETVLSRARRMFRSEMKKFAKDAFGMDEYDPETLKTQVNELKKARENGMSNDERYSARVQELEAKVIDLTTKFNASVQESTKAKRELAVATRETEKVRTEHEIKDLANKAGVRDLDYGLHLLRQHIKTLPPGEELNPEKIKGYFEGLKKDPAKRALFSEEQVAAGPKPLGQEVPPTQPAATQAAPAGAPAPSTIPPQGAPKPGEAGAGTRPDVNALDMNKRDFNKHARENYGFSPGMS